MQLIASPRRRTAAVLAAGALSLSGMAVLASSAHAAEPSTVTLTPSLVDTGATRATGHNDFQADGVRVWTEGATSTDKAAGYFDVHVPLADTGEPAMEWTNNTPENNYRPGMQLKVDFNGDGDIDGVLVGEPIYADGEEFLGNRWWLAGGADRKAGEITGVHALPVDDAQPSYRQNIATLDDWRAAYPSADVLGSGWSLGSGALGDGVISSITVGGTEYDFTNEESTNTVRIRKDQLDETDTRATGHNDFYSYAEGGVRVYTEGSTSTDKAAAYFDVDHPFAEIGEPSMDWTNNDSATNTRPGLQLVVDVDGDGTADGILVGERTYADGSPLYQDIVTATNWWLTNGSSQAFKDLAPSHDGGNGGENNGTLAEWRGALPDTATVVASGWSLGSGVKGDGDVDSITIGTTTYEFKANRAPQAADVSRAIAAGLTRSVALKGTDADGDALTYSVNGKELSGNKFSYKASTHFVGTKTFTYKADDGHGDTAEGTITINVVPAKTRATIKVTPKLTTKKVVRVRMDLQTSARTVGTVVRVSVDGKAAGAGVIKKNFVRITLGKKLTKGQHVIRALYVGNDYSTPIKVGTTVTVK